MRFSQRMSRISVSSTAAVVAKADRLKASGVDVVDFGAGEPDFPTPENIKQAAVAAIEQDFTKYTPTGGISELKQAIVERHARDFGSDYAVEECLVTVGGKQAIFEAIESLVDHGDEVILPVPYWVSFLDIINYAGGKPVLLETRESEDFAVRADAMEKLVTPKTKLIIVNSPSNPTGAVVPPGEMERILSLAQRRQVCLMSDECYCHFLYDGRKPFSLGSSRDRERLIIVGSLSKTYAMTGWRVGFALGSAALLANMLKLQSHSTSNPASIAQKAAVEALRGPQDSVQTMLAEYHRRRDRIVQGLRSIPGVRCVAPQGAFYVYPNVAAYLKTDGLRDTTVLATRLLDEARVALVPGPAFGTHEHVRISYATSQEQIDKGVQRLKDFLAKLGTAYAAT
ncbi:MAG: pyridoxal phosphate-dependent aminotransferase [Acidobacteria bacterium]|nr:MAG: pyridoxal phosphate-dependent aminotransferase [Acidobacteriota bacterium]